MKRSKFNLSNYKLLSCDMGELIPCGLSEVLPGDTWQHNTNVLVRCSPPLIVTGKRQEKGISSPKADIGFNSRDPEFLPHICAIGLEEELANAVKTAYGI